MSNETPLIVRHLGLQDYASVFETMKAFNDNRDASTADEIWLLEHHPVFTQGQAGKEEYILLPGDIPVVKSDRGGHVTYHGPGQIVCYPIVDLDNFFTDIHKYLRFLEETVILTLENYGIKYRTKNCCRI